MQFEPLELQFVDALGQQDVPDYFQQPAKAITRGCECNARLAGPGMDTGSLRRDRIVQVTWSVRGGT